MSGMGDGWEPDGYDGYVPDAWELDDLLASEEAEYEPDDVTDPALTSLFERLWGFGNITDAEADALGRVFDRDADPMHELYRAVLFLRRTRLTRPVLALLLWLLRLLHVLTREAGQDVGRPLGADRRPAADLTPPVALLRARSVLTCAPPARVRCPAGTTG